MSNVIYIMSDRRSGSTLLENILSKSDECFSIGELALLKGHLLKVGPGEKWNYTCSCGQPFTECVFWSAIVEKTFTQNFDEFFTAIHWNFKSKNLALNALFPSTLKEKIVQLCNSENNDNVIATLNAMYKLIAEQSGKKFIIDSSKNPVQALAVYKNRADINVKIIWLKRDIRAIAVSKSKWKQQNKKKKKSMLKRILDVFYYKRLCYSVSTIVKPADILIMDYESLAQQTHKELQRVFEAFGLAPFETPQFMELAGDHTIGGTPERFFKKPIQYDEGWKDKFKNNRITYFIGGILNKI
ncbi:MAG TPA: sulfotransferase domain-containing protein [Panacibacter sp.]|nr:sulfotransferase domain-containing protein [Panacibacter sp.]